MSDKPIITPGRPGSARVEYFACRAEVEAMLQQGYSVQMSSECMKEQGRVTCSYSAFCDYVRGNGKRMHSIKDKNQKPPQPAPQRSTGPRIINRTTGSIIDPRTMDINDAI